MSRNRKRSFSYQERYAVWSCNDQRCWICGQPLRLIDTHVDHVLPESLLWNEEERIRVYELYSLSEDFNINGFENWLPACALCNSKKGKSVPEFVPGHVNRLRKLIRDAGKTQQVAADVKSNVTKDKILSVVFSALEQQKITMSDLEEFLISIIKEPEKAGVPKDVIILDSGVWKKKGDIVREGYCTCDRNTCVGKQEKVYCYFDAQLSEWVVTTGLFWRCYDEVVACPRCGDEHIRGHIGRRDYCDNPYVDQVNQTD
ncbi:HNH endonuclease [Ruegeria atlantica]|uniref:HNH endonuclease n=1 Tax=Ruegeria atlantica TaxID=81569 RepID=UPI001481451B|nr:hypothetical protein [Ruegeria atlantica]